MKIHQFSSAQLDLFRDECDFNEFERQCFERKVQRQTDIQIANELFVSESTVAKTMRRIRSKIVDVLQDNVLRNNDTQSSGCGRCIVCHTMQEWSRIPDFLSTKGMLYIYLDYRTENDTDIPRIKIGDGVNSLSELPFATMSITDKDMEYWDNKPDIESNDFGKIVEISISEDLFTFPSDGYIMLEFESPKDYAKVNIYGASGKSSFEFSKPKDIDIHSKEVFVRKGMKCRYSDCSDNAKIKFIPLV